MFCLCNLMFLVEVLIIIIYGVVVVFINDVNLFELIGLVFFILDYEDEKVESCEFDYCDIRLSFSEIFFFLLLVGFNFGK